MITTQLVQRHGQQVVKRRVVNYICLTGQGQPPILGENMNIFHVIRFVRAVVEGDYVLAPN